MTVVHLIEVDNPYWIGVLTNDVVLAGFPPWLRVRRNDGVFEVELEDNGMVSLCLGINCGNITLDGVAVVHRDIISKLLDLAYWVHYCEKLGGDVQEFADMCGGRYSLQHVQSIFPKQAMLAPQTEVPS